MIISSVLFFSFIALGLWVYLLHHKKTVEIHNELSNWSKLNTKNEDIRKILLAGIYQRFKREEGKTEDTPFEFEHFVADTLRQYYQSEVNVTPPNNDGGVDLIHRHEGKMLLGQVKCHAPKNLVNYVPIALLHSQMIRVGADGGFLVTTSSYNRGAIDYAESVGIELIDGEQFLDMWMETIRMADEEYQNRSRFEIPSLS